MKKLYLLLAMFTLVCTSGAFAQKQESADPAAMFEEMKTRLKPQLVAEAKITEAQAERVFYINHRYQQLKREVRMDDTLNDLQKKQRFSELDAARDKEYAGGIHLTEDQIKAVNAFFDDSKSGKKKS